METQENWKPVPDYDGLYEVSDLGRVRSLDRVTSAARRDAMVIKGKVLKPALAANGYYTVALCKDGKPKSHTVHSLVAAAFLGPKPEGCVIDHIDGGRTDNRPANLRYVSQAVNSRNTPWRKGFKGKSGVRGVYKNGSGWMAMIVVRQQTIYLGTFRTIEEARACRDEYELRHGLQWSHERDQGAA